MMSYEYHRTACTVLRHVLLKHSNGIEYTGIVDHDRLRGGSVCWSGQCDLVHRATRLSARRVAMGLKRMAVHKRLFIDGTACYLQNRSE